MAKIKKKDFNFKDKFSTKSKYKEDSFYYCGEPFLKACGVPGPHRGSINMFLGHSNSSKTTAMILAAADAQRRGDLPVFIITEKKWSWSHAVELGVQAERNEDGEWDGDFIFNDSFDYIEQVTEFMNEIIDEQEKGNIPYNLLFLWDSVGSIPCKMTFDGKGGTQHNARTFADKIGAGLHSRITKTRKEEYPYINTLVVVNQPWVDLPDNPFGQPEIKPKGGEAIYLASSLVFLFGNQRKAGVRHIDATKDGRKVSFATGTKISILKNHVNGISFKDGKILATPHGYIDDTKEALATYKEEYSEYWHNIIGLSGDYELTETEEEVTFEDVKDEFFNG